MDQQQVRWALLKVSMVALSISSWIFVSFIFASRPEEVSAVTADPLVHLVRLPASLPGVPAQIIAAQQPKRADPIRMDVLRLPCWDMAGMAEQPIQSRWVRLSGRPCQSTGVPESIEVRNLSNGYLGTVFAAQPELYTTDFIPLQAGANEISVRIGENEGVAFENRFVLVKAAGE